MSGSDVIERVIIEEADLQDRTTIAGMMQRYLEEISPYTGQKSQGNGRWRYAELDLYWLESEERHPFLIRLGKRNIGFALARSVPGGTQLTEFYIAPDYRHRHHGTAALLEVFHRRPGRWAVKQNINHSSAQEFFRSVIRQVNSRYAEQIQTGKDGRSWTVQRFAV